MVFLSYRITTGLLEGKRQIGGDREAVVTKGPGPGTQSGRERRLPASCGNSRFLETSHSHILATLDAKEDKEVELLPLDLELMEARLDLLSYITQRSLANFNQRLLGDTCVGDAGQLAGLQ